MAQKTENQKTPEPKKKKKAKGPIRYEAIVPITIIFLLFFAYFKFFFDTHLRMGLEYGGTYANGAEVNIGYVKTSFLRASGEIGKIQVTNKETPARNIVEIGSMKFQALWDGLLRGKIVIPEASITDIMVNTVRKKPGKVLPPKKTVESEMESKQSNVLMAEANKVLDGSLFGDLADVAQGQDYKAKLKEMEGQLKSKQFIAKMEKELKEKEKLWKERIDKLPKKEEFKKIEDRVKALKVDGKDPVAIMNAVKEIDALYKEVDSKVKLVKDSKDNLSSDINTYKNVYSDIKKFIDEDIKDLENKMGIPSLDPKDLAMRVFGRQFAKEIQRAEKYMRVAREYMPPPKKPGDKAQAPTPREREVGKNYKFPKTKHYPKFWVQKAHVNSKATADGFSGTIAGDLINITDDQRSTGVPMEAKLSGEFPNSNIFGVVIHGVMDHTTEIAKETGTIKVGAFPLKDVMLSESKDLTFGFKEATGSSDLVVKFQEETLDINFNAGFDKINYLVEAKSSKVKEIMTNISASLGALTLNGRASGQWKSLDLDLNSNIGEKLQAALKAEFSNQVAHLKDKLREEVTGKIAAERDKLMGDVNGFEKKFGVSLASQEEAINSLKQKLNEEKSKATNKQQDKLKDAGKKLLKGLKF